MGDEAHSRGGFLRRQGRCRSTARPTRGALRAPGSSGAAPGPRGQHHLEWGCHRLARRAASAMAAEIDRKSTRLNSSHLVISYAVFCLKKKNISIIALSSDAKLA